MWTRLSEDAVLFPLQRADTDTALHRTVCQHYERMSGKYLSDCALTVCICSNICVSFIALDLCIKYGASGRRQLA